MLKHIKELLDQMNSFKRLRNIIFSDFTLPVEISKDLDHKEKIQQQEDLKLSMLYVTLLTC